MSHILRITVMWFLALAVPVQGFAAASMIGCGPGHHGTAGSHSHAIGMHEHALGVQQSHDSDGAEMAQADHHHHADAASHGDQHKAHADAKFSKASCSACASCCTSAALLSTPLVFEATDAPDSFVILAPHRVASFVSGGLERPPRSVLA